MRGPLAAFLRKELTQALRDPRMRLLLLVVPVVQLTIFGLALNSEVRNIRLAVYAAPSDTLAWQAARAAYASGYFLPSPAWGQPFDRLRAGDADAALVAAPGGMALALAQGRPGAQLLIDATNTVKARAIEAYLQAAAAPSLPQPPGGSAGVAFSVRVHYNPALRSPVFLVPGVMVMVLLMVTMILSSMSLAREKEMGTWEGLLAAPLSPWQLLLGKTLPYFLLGMADLPLLLMAAKTFFDVPIAGPLWMLALGGASFIACSVALGTLISTAARSQQQAMLGSFLFMFPAMQLSGLMFPVENMPAFIAWTAWLNPMFYFMELLRNVMLKGGAPAIFWRDFGMLAALAALLWVLAWRRMSQTLN
jgi:ABC-2 type transport system permease protein